MEPHSKASQAEFLSSTFASTNAHTLLWILTLSSISTAWGERCMPAPPTRVVESISGWAGSGFGHRSASSKCMKTLAGRRLKIEGGVISSLLGTSWDTYPTIVTDWRSFSDLNRLQWDLAGRKMILFGEGIDWQWGSGPMQIQMAALIIFGASQNSLCITMLY